jgi:hypothetical protein
MRRLLALSAFAMLVPALSACPDREEIIDRVGGAPGRVIEKVRDATERAAEDAEDRLEQIEE